jgi:hypothetical protein
MDVLLIIYSLFLLITVLSPFLLLHKKGEVTGVASQELLDIQSRRELLLENLKDLKTEVDTGKFSLLEFSDASREIVLELKKIDSLLKDSQIEPAVSTAGGIVCKNCLYTTSIANAKFCPMCGYLLG